MVLEQGTCELLRLLVGEVFAVDEERLLDVGFALLVPLGFLVLSQHF